MVLNLRPFTKSLMEKVDVNVTLNTELRGRMEKAIPSSSLKANMDLSLAPTIQFSGNLLKNVIILATIKRYLSP
jgi:hypothetical protein